MNDLFTYVTIIIYYDQKSLNPLTFLGGSNSIIASILFGSGLIPFLVTQYPKYSISFVQKVDFLALTFSPAFMSRSKMIFNLSR